MNTGLFKDRNPDMRAAGIASLVDLENTAHSCVTITHPEEMAEHLLSHQCRHYRIQDRSGPLFKRTPVLPDNNVKELLEIELSKSRFVQFKEMLSEDLYFKKAKLGQTKPCNSKPDSVTNLSKTFGITPARSESAYPLVLPNRSAEEVNREYYDLHEKHILSHCHYLPAEQINRKYTHPFSRYSTFGKRTNSENSGKLMKQIFHECDKVVFITKPQMDFFDRKIAPLGKKFKRYPYDVPQDKTYGTPTYRPECDCRMLVENISPCVSNNQLIDALSHLNMLRHKLQQRPNFLIFDLVSVLENDDKKKTGYLPLDRIIEIMLAMHIRVDTEKIRTIVRHFKILLDEGCPTERVNYDVFCRLLTIQQPLPAADFVSSSPTNSTFETTYRMLCDDLKKTPNELPPKLLQPKPQEVLDEMTEVRDLVTPDIFMKLGLKYKDFECLRNKESVQRIYKNIVDSDEFDVIWNELLKTYSGQNETFSVNQFKKMHDETHKSNS